MRTKLDIRLSPDLLLMLYIVGVKHVYTSVLKDNVFSTSGSDQTNPIIKAFDE